MAELTIADVRLFSDRFDDFDDAPLQALLDAALAAARRYCGWYVTPVVEDDEVTLDGPGGHSLSLPTLKLLEVTEVVEHGVTLDVALLDVSLRTGSINKWPYGCWTRRNGAIVVTFTHGFTETEAADWRRAVLRLVDLMTLEPVVAGTGREDPNMIRKSVGPVEYQWAHGIISDDERLSAMFSRYRILPSP
jgi:hypothetical protein